LLRHPPTRMLRSLLVRAGRNARLDKPFPFRL